MSLERNAMHKDFGEWYRLVAIEPDDAMLQKRWCAATEDEVSQMLDIVRLFLGQSPSQPEVAQRFIDMLRKHDAAFPQRNPLELQVLAGAAAANCITTDKDDSTRGMTVALAVAAGSFAAARPAMKLAEIADLTRNQLLDMSWRRRRRASGSLEDLAADQSIAKALETFSKAPFGDWNQVRAAVTAVFQDLWTTIEGLQNAMVDMDQDLTRADEECNMLWWLEGGCSRDFRAPWASTQREGVPVIAAKELGDLTVVLPGPHVAQALLHGVLSRVGLDTVSIADAVNKVPLDWLKPCLDSRRMSRASDLTPVWLALKHRAAANDDRAWQAFFEKTVGVDPAKQIKADDLAGQVYLEALFLKALDVED
jgi:hypothetical protein